MLSRKNTIKLVVVLVIVAIGAIYWYYAERRTSPIEEAEKAANVNVNSNTPPAENAATGAENAGELNKYFSLNNNAPATPSAKTMKTWPAPTVLPVAQRTNKEAVIQTNKGTIIFELLTDAPLAASNFIELAKGGFYDGLIFHRVVPNFVIQGGDPLGTGFGGPGYKFKDEPVSRAYDPGIVAMANSGPDTNGSQFFIMLPGNQGLPPQYTIFGKVISGMDVVSKIAVGDVMNKVTIANIK
jgi:peptidylprolyl isomerase/peptidyl-prolyl cis-trans isomerase B (cyclophilin B)